VGSTPLDETHADESLWDETPQIFECVIIRMREAAEAKRSMFSRNNKYHYEGRTEYQTRLDAEQIPRSGNDFTRLGGSSYVIVTKSGLYLFFFLFFFLVVIYDDGIHHD